MSWILTATGAQFDLELAFADSMSLLDVAHALALVNRFNGHTSRPYSVAEHSIHVCQIMEHDLHVTHPAALMAGLLHDAHEAYIGDMATPLKHAIGEPWHAIERRIEQRVQQRFGVLAASTGWRGHIERADRIALATERRDLMPPAGPDWPSLRGVPCAAQLDLRSMVGMDWKDWRDAFIDKFDELTEALEVQRRANGVTP